MNKTLITPSTTEATQYIQKLHPNFKPKLGIILGSGLNGFAELMQDSINIPYQELPDFVECSVAGHVGTMKLGYIEQVPLVCLQGRPHYYEGTHRKTYFSMIRTLKDLGCEFILLTNAAGSLHYDITPGRVVLVNDHINLMGFNPLLGPNDPHYGPRFIGLENAYDITLRKHFHKIAEQLGIELPEGVYLAVSGPSFETPAEIKAFRVLGADLVGMSTVPEVIIARHCDMKVAVLSAVTNFAAGMTKEQLTHETTLAGAQMAKDDMFKLLTYFIKECAHESF